MYTAAVEEDEEEIVKKTIAESKEKYSELNTKKTAEIVHKYLKMDGKGLNFRIGELILAAGVPKLLIEKAISTRHAVMNFTVLYTL